VRGGGRPDETAGHRWQEVPGVQPDGIEVSRHPLPGQPPADEHGPGQGDRDDHPPAGRRVRGERGAEQDRNDKRERHERSQDGIAQVAEDRPPSLAEVGDGDERPGHGGDDEQRVGHRARRADDTLGRLPHLGEAGQAEGDTKQVRRDPSLRAHGVPPQMRPRPDSVQNRPRGTITPADVPAETPDPTLPPLPARDVSWSSGGHTGLGTLTWHRKGRPVPLRGAWFWHDREDIF
jgi:hypothetical protein